MKMIRKLIIIALLLLPASAVLSQNPDCGKFREGKFRIADANAGGTGVGLANVDPIFTWVRLAQRIPVRIHMDSIPHDVKIVAGQTCMIFVTPSKEP